MPRVLKSLKAEPAPPEDHQDQNDAGEVVTYWDPGAFTWYGAEIQPRGFRDELSLTITDKGIRLSHAAGGKFAPEARIAVGLNRGFLALREAADGIKARRERKEGNTAIYLNSTKLGKLLRDEGWPIPCRLPAVWDERNGMLVCRKPPGEVV